MVIKLVAFEDWTASWTKVDNVKVDSWIMPMYPQSGATRIVPQVCRHHVALIMIYTLKLCFCVEPMP